MVGGFQDVWRTVVEIQSIFIDNWNAAGPLDPLAYLNQMAASLSQVRSGRTIPAASLPSFSSSHFLSFFVLSPLSLRRSFRVQADLSQRCSPRSQ